MYDVAIIGGGIAGLQAAVQLGRYRHRVIVIDAGDGRSSLCRKYSNLLGYPDGISGSELLAAGREHAGRLGVQFMQGVAIAADQDPSGDSFVITVTQPLSSDADPTQLHAKRLLLATGVKDRLPDWPALLPCMGISVYICPDCDGYEVWGKPVLVLGAGNAGAGMALELLDWTREITYINHEGTPIDPEKRNQLQLQGIAYIEQPVREVLADGEQLRGIVLADGTEIAAERAFTAFGGNEIRSSLAASLGVKLASNRHIEVDPRTRQTSLKHVWAAGDVTVHSEQVAIAMGDGSQAAIWIHKSLPDK